MMWFKCQDCGLKEDQFNSVEELTTFVKHHQEKTKCKNIDFGAKG